MSSIKFQLEEYKKSNPRYVLELHTIRGMVQEVDNMDKGLRTVLGLPRQPTDADYQALLASILSESSAIPLKAISILLRFSCTSGADLEAHHVPSHIVAFMEQHRGHLQRAAQGNDGAPRSIVTQSARTMPIRRPTADELTSAKRWVEEQKRTAFNHNFDDVIGPQVPESEIQEYTRNLEHLDTVLGSIERYMHIAFAALRKEDVVRRMFAMMASTKFQLEECKKPNPRYVLELHTIRGMKQEAENMDRGGSHPPSTTSFQLGQQAKQSQALAPGVAMSTPTPPMAPTVPTPTLQASTASITMPSPQPPKFPKGKAAANPMAPVRLTVSAKVDSLETALSAPAVAPTSTLVDKKGSSKRAREHEVDGVMPEVAFTPSPKRAKYE
ncbi:hypothetical protein EI94DRAFT_1695884 [Lactarius quietus]|nr:hypothetical protein EI94DRAFT_1695884 [Lactarius quietus]